MKKTIAILGLVVGLGLGMGMNGYTSTPEYQTKKELKVVNNKIESNIRLQSVMVKNQKHGKRYTSAEWEAMHEELQKLRNTRKELQARVK